MSPLYDPSVHGSDDFENNTRKKAFQRQQRAGRGARPLTGFRIGGRFKPPENDRTWIRLIPERHQAFDGAMQPYHERMEHFHSGIKQSFICSKVWKEDMNAELSGSGKCLLCADMDSGAKNISARQLDSFLLVHLDHYYLAPLMDKSGKPMVYDQDTKFRKKGDPVLTKVWQEAEDKDLKRLKLTRRELKKCEKTFGKLMHWSLGPRFLGTLSSAMDDLMRYCKCGGRIELAVLECKKCHEEILDLTDGGAHLPEDMTVKQANKMALTEYRCPYCGHLDFLQPIRDCDNCQDPNHPKLWEVDLEVGRIGSGTQSQLMIYDHRICDLDERVVDLIPERELLHRVFAPDSLKYQAKQLGIRNPYEDEADKHIEKREEEEDAEVADINF